MWRVLNALSFDVAGHFYFWTKKEQKGNSAHVSSTSNRQISQGAKWLINAILVMPKGLPLLDEWVKTQQIKYSCSIQYILLSNI